MHGHACKQYIFHSCNICFQCDVFHWKSFHMTAWKIRRKQFRVSNFALWLFIFKRHHGSEGVNSWKPVENLHLWRGFYDEKKSYVLFQTCRQQRHCCTETRDQGLQKNCDPQWVLSRITAARHRKSPITTGGSTLIIIIIVLIKRHFLTQVKLIVLYKQLDKKHICIHFNKQSLKYSILL